MDLALIEQTTLSTTTIQAPQPQSTQRYVSYTDYADERMLHTSPESKTVPNTGPNTPNPTPQTYKQIPLMYNYSQGVTPLLDDAMVEGCEMESPDGIRSTVKDGKTQYSVMVRFDNSIESNGFVSCVGKIHMRTAAILGSVKGAVGLHEFDAERPNALYKNPIYRPRDPTTGNLIEGKPPSIYFKLFKRGKDESNETMFTDLEGKRIPWALLKNVKVKFVPLIHIKRIYVGAKPSLQMEMVSAIVTDIHAKGSQAMQLDTINRLKEARPELADTVAAQLSKLTLDRQDQLLGHTAAASTNTNAPDTNNPPENQPTYTGIGSAQRQLTSSQYVDNQQYQNTIGNLPQIPSLGNQNMQDFTSMAPNRNAMLPNSNMPTGIQQQQFQQQFQQKPGGLTLQLT
jgi:hypothetical protein